MQPIRTFLALAMALTMPLAFAGTPLPDGPHVVVPGEGEVSIAPDRVVLKLSVAATDADPAQAKRRVDDAVSRYLEVLERHKVPVADVTASSLRLDEQVERDDDGRPVSRGHRAVREVSARVSDVAGFNRIIDEGLAAGMQSIDDIRFESSRADTLRIEARRRAAAASRMRAEQLAEAYGARLGRIYSINSVNSGLMPAYGGGLDRIEVSGSRLPARYLQPKIEFSERVQVVFELLP